MKTINLIEIEKVRLRAVHTLQVAARWTTGRNGVWSAAQIRQLHANISKCCRAWTKRGAGRLPQLKLRNYRATSFQQTEDRARRDWRATCESAK